MGQKVHPIGFRLGVTKDWNAKWYADKNYTDLVHEDLRIRGRIRSYYPDAGISEVDVERGPNQVTVTVNTSKPGIVIGRGGQKVDELRGLLEKATGKRVRLNIHEIRFPEIDARLVAQAVAEQLKRRVAHRRAMKQAIARALQRGAQGIKIKCSGRLGGAEMARREWEMEGRVPLHTLRADIDYGLAEAATTLGRVGVKVWIYKGQIQREKTPPPTAEAGSTRAPRETRAPESGEASAPRPALTATKAAVPVTVDPTPVEAPPGPGLEEQEVITDAPAETSEIPEGS